MWLSAWTPLSPPPLAVLMENFVNVINLQTKTCTKTHIRLFACGFVGESEREIKGEREREERD